MSRRTSIAIACGMIAMLGGKTAIAAREQVKNAAPALEVLDVALETEVSGGTFDDSARPADATKTKFVVVTARFPRGSGYSTKELVLEHDQIDHRIALPGIVVND